MLAQLFEAVGVGNHGHCEMLTGLQSVWCLFHPLFKAPYHSAIVSLLHWQYPASLQHYSTLQTTLLPTIYQPALAGRSLPLPPSIMLQNFNSPYQELLPTSAPIKADVSLPSPRSCAFSYKSASILSFLHVLLFPFLVLRFPMTAILRSSLFWLFLVLLYHFPCCPLFPFVPPMSHQPCDLSSSSLLLVFIFLVVLFPT